MSRPLDRRLIFALVGVGAILVFAVVVVVAVQSARSRPAATTSAAAAPPTATLAPPAVKAGAPSATPLPVAATMSRPTLAATATSLQTALPATRAQAVAPTSGAVAKTPASEATAIAREEAALAPPPGYIRYARSSPDFSVNIPASWQNLGEDAKGRTITFGSPTSKTGLTISMWDVGQDLDALLRQLVREEDRILVPAAKTAVGHYAARQVVADAREPSSRTYLAAVSAPNRTFALEVWGPPTEPALAEIFGVVSASFRVPAQCGAAVCPELLQGDAVVGTPVPAPVVAAATPSPTPAPMATSSLVPSICWFLPDDLKSLPGAPADFQQLEGAAESWEAEGRQVVQYGGFVYLKRSNGSLLLWCNVYDHPIALDFQTPSGYTVVNAPRVGQLSVAMQSKNVQSIQFVKENVEVVLRLRDAAPYVTTDNVVKLASIIAERMPATIPLSGPPSPPQAANERAFSNYFKKFEIGTGDPFVAASTVAADDYVGVSVATIDPQQRYSLWLLDDKQNVVAAVRGIQGTQIISTLDTGKAGKYTVLLEAAGVMYARQVITKQ